MAAVREPIETTQLDAELMTPFLLEAYSNASTSQAPELTALASDPEIAEALTQYLSDEGVRFISGIAYERIEPTANGVRLIVAKSGERIENGSLRCERDRRCGCRHRHRTREYPGRF